MVLCKAALITHWPTRLRGTVEQDCNLQSLSVLRSRQDENLPHAGPVGDQGPVTQFS